MKMTLLPGSRAAALLLAAMAPCVAGAGPAAEADFGGRLAGLEERVSAQDESLRSIRENATLRSGFISAADARRRYEDAVFLALMGNLEEAALGFSILVSSGAVDSETIRTDAEWYLAETLFELGNYATADETYGAIVAQGEAHPFFEGAVRRLLELYGITGESERFYELYNRYIATGRVAANGLIRYTVARSLYRQGDWARAKSLFSECCTEGPLWAKAHYFIGTILVLQGDTAAAAEEFRQVSAVSVTDEETRKIVDLANLALGRVLYENGDYRAATDAYLRVGRDSAYFADQLYELVWTFIKQEDHTEAIRAVEIFLLAYPEHRYTAQLKVLKGHLHMKQERYESAHAAYDKVVTEYSPIRDLVAAVAVSREQPQVFFERLAMDDSLRALDQAGLPPFAAEMLYGRDDVHLIVDLRRELVAQQQDLDVSDEIAEELELALVGGVNALGAFRGARDTLRWLQADSLSLMNELLALEEDYIAAATTGRTREEVLRLREEHTVVSDVAAGNERAGAAREERVEVRRNQVRAVQSQAFLVEQVARDLLTEAEATEQYLESGQHRLSQAAAADLRKDLFAVQQELRTLIQQLRPLQGEAALRAILGPTGAATVASEDAAREKVLSNYADIRRSLAGMRSRVTTPGAYDWFSRMDGLWVRLDAQLARVAEVEVVIDRVEQEEIRHIREEFSREVAHLAELRSGVGQAFRETEELGVHATREGFEELAEFFNSSVMRADLGIVDVYWLRKVQISDRIDLLNTERVELMKELDRRFEAINSKLEK